MSDVRILWEEIMACVECAAIDGKCACVALSHVADQENFVDTINEVMAIADGVLRYSAPDLLEGNVGHLLTAVVALGYAMGSADAYDITLSSDLSIPDDLSNVDFVESYGERPDSE